MTTKKLEEITGKLCDRYCIHSRILCHEDEQETLDEICKHCPMNEMVELIDMLSPSKKTKVTVYDKIKTMDIDALANVIYSANDQVCFNNCTKETGNKYACKFGAEVTVENCKDCIKSWLESEDKVDE